MKFVRNVAGVFGTALFGLALSMVTGIVTARALAPHYRGLWALIDGFPGTLQSINNMGFSSAIVYSIRKSRKDAPQIIFNFLCLALIIGCCTVAVVYSLRGYLLETILRGVEYEYFYVILLVCPALLVTSYMSNGLAAFEKFKLVNYVTIAQRIIMFMGVIAVLIVFKVGLRGMVYMRTVLLIGIAITLVVLVHRNIGMAAVGRPALVKRAVPYAAKTYTINMTGYMHYQVDKYIINYFLAPDQVAFYTVGVGLVEMLFHLPDSVGYVLFPTLVDKSREDMIELSCTVCRNVLFITAIAALALLGAGSFAIRILYGEAYQYAYTVIPLLLPGIVLMSGYKVLSRYFMGINKHESIGYVSGLSLTMNVILNVMMIPRYGIQGAAISTSITYALAFLFVLSLFVKATGRSGRDVLLITRGDISRYHARIMSLFG